MKNNDVGPDLFGFYKSEVAELLSQDEELLPFPYQFTQFPGNNHERAEAITIHHDDLSPLFSNGVGALLSEYRRERLNSMLRQSVNALSHEVEEMAFPVFSVCRMRSILSSKEKPSGQVTSVSKAGDSNHGQKKFKASPPTSISEDLNFLLENESSKVEEVINKHSDDLSDMLVHMEQNLEELLNTTMTTCRPMSLSEKEELCKLIHKLSPQDLDGVAEILRRNKSATRMDEIGVDLDEEVGEVRKLWRCASH